MQLAALSAGGQAPRGRFNGAVHSVFRQACNVRLDDGRLLVLLARHLGNVPHGVRVDVPAGFGFARQAAVGQRVGCRADVLRVGGGRLAIDLGTARTWHGQLPAAGVDLMSPKTARAWRTAWHATQHCRPRTHGLNLARAVGAAHRRGVRLARAARVLQPEEAASALDCLIGCGPGLTPSGDDLTVGFLAGLFSTTSDRPARRAFLDGLCAAVAGAAVHTTDISRAYLTHAARGHFAQPLVTLAARIAEGADLDRVQRATMAALRVGHTSGADGVSGLLLGLAAWAPQAVLPGLARPDDVLASLDRARCSPPPRPARPAVAVAGHAAGPIASSAGPYHTRIAPGNLQLTGAGRVHG